jgi:hypothetical protein
MSKSQSHNGIRSIDSTWEQDEVSFPGFDGYGFLTWTNGGQSCKIYINKDENNVKFKGHAYLRDTEILSLGYGDGLYGMVYDSFDKENMSFWRIENNKITSNAFFMLHDLFSFSPDYNTNILSSLSNKRSNGSLTVVIGEHSYDITKDGVHKHLESIDAPSLEHDYDYYLNQIKSAFAMFTGLDYEINFT